MRAFVAFDLAIKVVEKLVLLQEDLHRPVIAAGATPRWIEASNIHLTLKYLGEIEVPMIARVRQALREVARRHPIFDIDTVGVGCFPGPLVPRIIWAGADKGSPEAIALQEDSEATLHELGIAREDRRFYPHVTLGRMKTKKSRVDLGPVLAPYEQAAFGTSQVKDIALFKSTLSPKGAVYEVIERFPLTG